MFTASPKSSAHRKPVSRTPFQHGIKTAATTLRHLAWFEVTQIKGHVVEGEVGHYQVCMKLGFRYDPK